MENAGSANIPRATPWREHFDDMVFGKQPTTIRKYKRHFEFLVSALKQHDMFLTEPDGITTRQLKEIAMQAREQSSTDNVARDRIGFVVVFWEFLFQEEHVAKNRARALGSLKPKKESRKGKERTLTRNECRLMYEAAKKLDPMYLAIFVCTYAAGQRRFEAAKLRASECTVRKDGSVSLCFRGKGDKLRTVPLGIDASGPMRHFLERAKKRDDAHQWLFPGRKNGEHICDDTVYNHIVALGRATGLDKKHGCNITPHWLRHAFATHAGQAGCDLKTISEQMGHANASTTSTYLHANTAKGAAASDYLNFENEKKKKKKKKKNRERAGPAPTRKEVKRLYLDLKSRKDVGEQELAMAKARYKALPKVV